MMIKLGRMSRAATAAGVGVLLSVTVATHASVAAPGHDPAPAERPEPTAIWKPCGDGARFQCTTVRVPVNRAKPKGPKIGIAVARLKASNPRARIGSLIINPGGPGGSGVGFAFQAEKSFAPKLLERFDIVGFDPRGVGASKPVLCDAALLDRAPQDYPATRAQFDAFTAYNRALSADCRAHTGPVFDHVDTISAARDMDAVRAALGERKVSFYGVSYGTQLFSQYLELYPHRVRAMTLDSNSDHTETDAGRMLKLYSKEFEDAVTQFARWCTRTSGCALGVKDARVVLDELYRRAEQGELSHPSSPTVKITPAQLLGELFGGMYSPKYWPEVAGWLTELDTQRPSAASSDRRAPEDLAPNLAPNPYPAIVCQDWGWGRIGFDQVERYRRQAAAVAPHTRMTLFWSDVIGCADYRVTVNNPQRRLKIKGAPKVLMTNSRYDVATALFSARGLATQIPTATLLTYDGVGHGDYWLSECAREAINTYLLTLRTPPTGARCPAVWPAGSRARSKPDDLSPPWLLPGVGGGPPRRPFAVH